MAEINGNPLVIALIVFVDTTGIGLIIPAERRWGQIYIIRFGVRLA